MMRVGISLSCFAAFFVVVRVGGYEILPKFEQGEKVDLGGRLLKVAVEQWKPHTILSTLPDGTLTASGPAPSLLHEISKILNFRYEYIRSVDNTWGSPLANGTWQGMIGMTMRKEVDMALGPFGLSESRTKVVKFTIPIHHDAVRILMKRPIPVPDPWGFLMPYDYYVWSAIVGTFLIVSFFSAIAVNKIDSKLTHENNNRKEIPGFIGSYTKMMWNLYSLFLQQSIKWCPKGSVTHWILFLWFVTAVVMIKSYNSALTSLLAVRTVPITVNNLADMVHKSDLDMIFEANTALSEYLTKADTGIFGDLAKEKSRLSFRKLSNLFSVAPTTDVAANTGAILTEETGCFIIYSESFSNKGTCEFIMAKETFWPLMFCLIGPLDSPITDYLNVYIAQLLEAGFYSRWMLDQVANYSSCAKAPTKFTITESYDLTGLWGMFVLLFLGLIASLLVFFCELATSYFR